RDLAAGRIAADTHEPGRNGGGGAGESWSLLHAGRGRAAAQRSAERDAHDTQRARSARVDLEPRAAAGGGAAISQRGMDFAQALPSAIVEICRLRLSIRMLSRKR